ncbi:hypothetical protein SLEP1_g15248 [Rubroshorea leprosula]|uniref:Reverse transcriptase Ty1/copia-type domain-containing protein n=1 Tax=Rubroshorea leprosula TaxID=152421 RepID=A0AAV5IVL3_9ROSI|nr:hypothetical protein SLEP1_g15248 [Rubroshorea leprosula]
MVAKEVIDQPIINPKSLKQVILNLLNAPTTLSTTLDALPVGNALDNAESFSLSSYVSPVGSDPVGIEPENEILSPPSSCPTRARLVAKGFTQEYGIDYEETFVLVARLTSIHILITIATAKGWKLFRMDVKNAFVNGDLTEEVYMQPPPGLEYPPNKVCHLKRPLYSLKQVPRAWFPKFSTTINEFGFTSSPYDTALFIRKTNHGMVLLLLYVDDMIITRDDMSGIHDVKQFLSHKFEMKDLGVLSYFLGLEVTSSDDGYLFSQTKYASDLIFKAGLIDSKVAFTPFEPNVRLTPMDDIDYVVHVVSQFMATPRSTHYVAVLRIIRYIKGTIFHGLHFSTHSSLELHAYFDADWVKDFNDHKSVTGYCLFLGDSLISWHSKKQPVPSHSSTEAEYQALGDTISELLNLCWLLKDMGVPQPPATDLYYDNQSAMQIAHNDIFHERTKHIKVDYHFVRHHVAQGIVHLVLIGSADQQADLFTKAHFHGRFHTLVSKLKLVSSQPP